MRRYKAEYVLDGRTHQMTIEAEKVKFSPSVDGHSLAEFSVYNEKSASYDVIGCFEYSALISMVSEDL